MLHIINRSPYERPALKACLRVAQAGSTLLLIEDGVYAAADGGEWQAQIRAVGERVKVYVLTPDVEARGLSSRIPPEFTGVDYGGFVDLVTQHSAVQSWL